MKVSVKKTNPKRIALTKIKDNNEYARIDENACIIFSDNFKPFDTKTHIDVSFIVPNSTSNTIINHDDIREVFNNTDDLASYIKYYIDCIMMNNPHCDYTKIKAILLNRFAVEDKEEKVSSKFSTGDTIEYPYMYIDSNGNMHFANGFEKIKFPARLFFTCIVSKNIKIKPVRINDVTKYNKVYESIGEFVDKCKSVINRVHDNTPYYDISNFKAVVVYNRRASGNKNPMGIEDVKNLIDADPNQKFNITINFKNNDKADSAVFKEITVGELAHAWKNLVGFSKCVRMKNITSFCVDLTDDDYNKHEDLINRLREYIVSFYRCYSVSDDNICPIVKLNIDRSSMLDIDNYIMDILVSENSKDYAFYHPTVVTDDDGKVHIKSWKRK